MKSLKVKIYGSVQGVGFRYNARDMADDLGINGFARNEADGSVYIEAEGPEAALQKFLAWCKEGSWPAGVEKMEFSFSDNIEGRRNFEVL